MIVDRVGDYMAFLDQIIQALGSFSPHILGALAILIVGWIIALIVSSLIGKALRHTGLDEKIAQMAVGKEKAEAMEPDRWISRIIYYVLLFFG